MGEQSEKKALRLQREGWDFKTEFVNVETAERMAKKIREAGKRAKVVVYHLTQEETIKHSKFFGVYSKPRKRRK